MICGVTTTLAQQQMQLSQVLGEPCLSKAEEAEQSESGNSHATMSPAVNSTKKRAVNRNALAQKPIPSVYTISRSVASQPNPFNRVSLIPH